MAWEADGFSCGQMPGAPDLCMLAPMHRWIGTGLLFALSSLCPGVAHAEPKPSPPVAPAEREQPAEPSEPEVDAIAGSVPEAPAAPTEEPPRPEAATPAEETPTPEATTPAEEPPTPAAVAPAEAAPAPKVAAPVDAAVEHGAKVERSVPSAIQPAQREALRRGGLKGGVNAGRFVGTVDATGINFGLALGGFARFALTDELVLQIEVLMTDKGSDIEGVTETMSEALLFLEAPMLVRYDFHRSEPARFYGLGGPSAMLLLDANLVSESDRAPVDFAAHLGLGFELGLDRHDVIFELRAAQGLRNLIQDGSGKRGRSSSVSLYAGITL